MSIINPVGTNLNPISNYNEILNNTMNEIGKFNQNESLNNFENILNDQMKGSIDMNVGFDTQANDKAAKSSVEMMMNQFGNATNESLNSLNKTALDAEKAVETFATGGDISVHDVMIASEKSSLSMNLAIQIRNRLLSAYTELNNVRF